MANAKAAKKKAPPRKPNRTNATASGDGQVRVRMYRQGLGDCFLITFNCNSKNPQHVLIDCGTLGRSSADAPTVEQVLEDIKITINKDALSAVVVTHEHKDHLSGFFKKPLAKANLKPNEIWKAWTEDPNDRLANQLRNERVKLTRAAAAAVKMGALAGDGSELRQAASQVLEFGEGDQSGGPAHQTLDEAMKYVETLVQPDRRRYLMPGNRIDDIIRGFQVFVLGPPHDFAKLRDLGTHGSDALYGVVGALQANGADEGDAVNLDDDAPTSVCIEEMTTPFDVKLYRRSERQARTDYPNYFDAQSAWRGIDNVWRDAGYQLALQLDSLTNNTSLVLAFRRISDGKVLLFPADAQLGNWQSWSDDAISWEVDGPASGSKTRLDAQTLLKNTVFLKVGHHGSFNGTARTKGLEWMTHGDLTAFIPVDREVAMKKKPQWNMPDIGVYLRLLDKCNGRVIRSDLGFASPDRNKGVEATLARVTKSAFWASWKKVQDAAKADGRVVLNDNFIDFFLF